MENKKPLCPVLSVRLFRGEKGFGPGIAKLLARVAEHHSLRAAAASMDMAYSKAWKILNASEAALGFPLLHRATGGKGGGGAELTPEAETLLERYTTYTQALQAEAERLCEEFFKGL